MAARLSRPRGSEPAAGPDDHGVGREGHRGCPRGVPEPCGSSRPGVGREPTGHLPAGTRGRRCADLLHPRVDRPGERARDDDERARCLAQRHDLVRRQHARGARRRVAAGRRGGAAQGRRTDRSRRTARAHAARGVPEPRRGHAARRSGVDDQRHPLPRPARGQPGVWRPHVRRIERHPRGRVRQRRRVAASRHLDRHRRWRAPLRRHARVSDERVGRAGRRGSDHGADRRVQRPVDRAPLVRRRGRRLEEGDGDRRPRHQRRRGVPPRAAARSAVSRLRGARQGAEA